MSQTEAEWLDATNPTPMLSFLQRTDTGSQRKWYLFACICLRNYARRVIEGGVCVYLPFVTWIETTERYVDGIAARSEWAAAGSNWGNNTHEQDVRTHAVWAADTSAQTAGWHNCNGFYRNNQRDDEYRRETASARDIFGNPFRPVTFSPGWRTETAVTLAPAVRVPRLRRHADSGGRAARRRVRQRRHPRPLPRSWFPCSWLLGVGLGSRKSVARPNPRCTGPGRVICFPLLAGRRCRTLESRPGR
jgi:hypothetical protein